MEAVVKLAELIEDWSLYPREKVDDVQVARLIEAFEAGENIPPIVVDKASKRIVDGYHRCRAAKRAGREELNVELRDFASEESMLLEAIRLNARHGVPLGRQDQARVINLGKHLHISYETMASALGIRVIRLKIIKQKMGRLGKRELHLKPALQVRFAGQTIPQAVADINPKLGGNDAMFYARQLLMLLGADALPQTDEMDKLLRELRGQLGRYLKGR